MSSDRQGEAAVVIDLINKYLIKKPATVGNEDLVGQRPSIDDRRDPSSEDLTRTLVKCMTHETDHESAHHAVLAMSQPTMESRLHDNSRRQKMTH